MGMCKVSGGINKFVGRIGSLKGRGDADSKSELYSDEAMDNLIQERWYDSNGDAFWNRDWEHGGDHEFPHDHDWDWERKIPRGEEHLKPNYKMC